MANRHKPHCLSFKKLFTGYHQLSIFVHAESLGVGSAPQSSILDIPNTPAVSGFVRLMVLWYFLVIDIILLNWILDLATYVLFSLTRSECSAVHGMPGGHELHKQ